MRFEVGEDLVLDTAQRKVWLADRLLDLPERSYLLLLTLVEQAPNIVSHNTLIETVWPGRVVSDENLKQRVSRLRKTLNNADYLIAERGLGYRLSANVTKLEHPQEVERAATNEESEQQFPTNQPTLKSFKISALAAGFAVVLLAASAVTLMEPAPPEEKLGQFTAMDYNRQAVDYYYRFKPADNTTAIKLFNKAIDTDPDFAQPYSGLANAYAQGYFQYGKPVEWIYQSITHSERAIEIADNEPWGYKSLGLAQHLAGQFDNSVASYTKAMEMAPWWPSPVNNRAFVLLEAGKLIEAHQDALSAVKMDVKDPIPYLFIGLIYSRLGMTAHALKSINQSVDFKPDYLLAQNYLAEFHLDQGQYDKARALLHDQIASHPYSQFAYWLLAQSYLLDDQQDMAAKHFSKAATIGGRHRLPSKIYAALIHQDHAQINALSSELQQTLSDGNLWPELYFAKALIQANGDNTEPAIVSLKEAIEKGFLLPNRLTHTPWLKPLSDKPAFAALMSQLKGNIDSQRQQVMAP